MEIAKSLVKCVARAFYDTKHILVVDALMIHNAYVYPPACWRASEIFVLELTQGIATGCATMISAVFWDCRRRTSTSCAGS